MAHPSADRWTAAREARKAYRAALRAEIAAAPGTPERSAADERARVRYDALLAAERARHPDRQTSPKDSGRVGPMPADPETK